MPILTFLWTFLIHFLSFLNILLRIYSNLTNRKLKRWRKRKKVKLRKWKITKERSREIWLMRLKRNRAENCPLLITRWKRHKLNLNDKERILNIFWMIFAKINIFEKIYANFGKIPKSKKRIPFFPLKKVQYNLSSQHLGKLCLSLAKFRWKFCLNSSSHKIPGVIKLGELRVWYCMTVWLFGKIRKKQ